MTKDFGDANAKVYSGFEVPPKWVTAADFAVTKMVSKGKRDAAVDEQMERGTITRARTGCGRPSRGRRRRNSWG